MWKYSVHAYGPGVMLPTSCVDNLLFLMIRFIKHLQRIANHKHKFKHLKAKDKQTEIRSKAKYYYGNNN